MLGEHRTSKQLSDRLGSSTQQSLAGASEQEAFTKRCAPLVSRAAEATQFSTAASDAQPFDWEGISKRPTASAASRSNTTAGADCPIPHAAPRGQQRKQATEATAFCSKLVAAVLYSSDEVSGWNSNERDNTGGMAAVVATDFGRHARGEQTSVSTGTGYAGGAAGAVQATSHGVSPSEAHDGGLKDGALGSKRRARGARGGRGADQDTHAALQKFSGNGCHELPPASVNAERSGYSAAGDIAAAAGGADRTTGGGGHHGGTVSTHSFLTFSRGSTETPSSLVAAVEYSPETQRAPTGVEGGLCFSGSSSEPGDGQTSRALVSAGCGLRNVVGMSLSNVKPEDRPFMTVVDDEEASLVALNMEENLGSPKKIRLDTVEGGIMPSISNAIHAAGQHAPAYNPSADGCAVLQAAAADGTVHRVFKAEEFARILEARRAEAAAKEQAKEVPARHRTAAPSTRVDGVPNTHGAHEGNTPPSQLPPRIPSSVAPASCSLTSVSKPNSLHTLTGTSPQSASGSRGLPATAPSGGSAEPTDSGYCYLGAADSIGCQHPTPHAQQQQQQMQGISQLPQLSPRRASSLLFSSRSLNPEKSRTGLDNHASIVFSLPGSPYAPSRSGLASAMGSTALFPGLAAALGGSHGAVAGGGEGRSPTYSVLTSVDGATSSYLDPEFVQYFYQQQQQSTSSVASPIAGQFSPSGRVGKSKGSTNMSALLSDLARVGQGGNSLRRTNSSRVSSSASNVQHGEAALPPQRRGARPGPAPTEDVDADYSATMDHYGLGNRYTEEPQAAFPGSVSLGGLTEMSSRDAFAPLSRPLDAGPVKSATPFASLPDSAAAGGTEMDGLGTAHVQYANSTQFLERRRQPRTAPDGGAIEPSLEPHLQRRKRPADHAAEVDVGSNRAALANRVPYNMSAEQIFPSDAWLQEGGAGPGSGAIPFMYPSFGNDGVHGGETPAVGMYSLPAAFGLQTVGGGPWSAMLHQHYEAEVLARLESGDAATVAAFNMWRAMGLDPFMVSSSAANDALAREAYRAIVHHNEDAAASGTFGPRGGGAAGLPPAAHSLPEQVAPHFVCPGPLRAGVGSSRAVAERSKAAPLNPSVPPFQPGYGGAAPSSSTATPAPQDFAAFLQHRQQLQKREQNAFLASLGQPGGAVTAGDAKADGNLHVAVGVGGVARPAVPLEKGSSGPGRDREQQQPPWTPGVDLPFHGVKDALHPMEVGQHGAGVDATASAVDGHRIGQPVAFPGHSGVSTMIVPHVVRRIDPTQLAAKESHATVTPQRRMMPTGTSGASAPLTGNASSAEPRAPHAQPPSDSPAKRAQSAVARQSEAGNEVAPSSRRQNGGRSHRGGGASKRRNGQNASAAPRGAGRGGNGGSRRDGAQQAKGPQQPVIRYQHANPFSVYEANQRRLHGE